MHTFSKTKNIHRLRIQFKDNERIMRSFLGAIVIINGKLYERLRICFFR